MKKTDAIIAFLGKETNYEGSLTFSGTVRIDGHFKGHISAAGTLIVGQTAVVEADIHVSDIIITGEIRGTILADNKIEIHPPGKTVGDIQAATVVIHEEAIFEGNCRMSGRPGSNAETRSTTEASEHADESGPGLGTIQGRVMNHQAHSSHFYSSENDNSDEPITGATISAQCNGLAQKNSITDDTGFYELIDLEDGTWNLFLEVHGYKPINAEVEVRGGGTYTQNFDYKSHDDSLVPNSLDERHSK